MHVKFKVLSFALAFVALTPALAMTPADAAAKQTVSIKLASAKVTTTQSTHITGTVSPKAAGKAIRLQRYYSKAWHGFLAKKLTAKSTYDFTVKMTKAGVYTFRVASPSAMSKSVKLTVVAPTRPVPPGRPISPQ